MKKVYTLVIFFSFATCLSVFAQEKKRVGVLPFTNKSGKKYGWLSEGFASTMTEALSQIQSIYLVDRAQVNSVIKKGKYTSDQLFSSQGAYEIGNQLGLDYVILGAFRIQNNNLDAILFLADAKKKGEYIEACSFNSVKSMASMWQVYEELVETICKTACFNVTITAEEMKKIKSITGNTQKVSAYEYYIKGRKEHLTFSVKGYEKANAYYDSALAIDPNYALAYGARGEATAFWGYQKEINAEEFKYMYDNAFKDVQKALTISGNIGSIHRNMATTYQMLRRFEDAKQSAKKAIELNGNDAEAWYMLWRASDDWNDVNSPSIQKAITISPYLPVANLQLGNQYMDQKQFDKAEEYYKRALTGNDEFELAWANLGNLYVTMKRYEDAVTALKRAIELKPQYAYALYSLGLAYWYLENWTEVINAWEECLKVDPNHELAKKWLPAAKEKLTGK